MVPYSLFNQVKELEAHADIVTNIAINYAKVDNSARFFRNNFD
jgi:hypothetical protein